MPTDFTDKDLNKRILCKYCKLPINQIPLILTSEPIFLGIKLINHPVHPECLGPYISDMKNRALNYLALVLSVIGIILAIVLR